MLNLTPERRKMLYDPLYLTDRTDSLEREIAENCWFLSLTERELETSTPYEIALFLEKVKQNRREQLRRSPLPISAITYYLWMDDQAGHLRFNFIHSGHAKLPFGCRIHRVERENDILQKCFQMSSPDGISLEEFREVDVEGENGLFDSADAPEEDSDDDPLDVYVETITR